MNDEGLASATRLDGILGELIAEVKAVKKQQNDVTSEKVQLESQYQMLFRAYKTLEMEKQKADEALVAAERIENSSRRVLCLIDGDGAIFSRALITRGRAGGLDAVRRLMHAIRDSLAGAPQFQLWTYCFLNKRGLAGALGVPDAVLDDFIAGFNQADSRAFAVDIGPGKERADARIRDLLKEGASSPHTLKVFLAACHDNGYAPDLDGLITQNLRSKLVLVPGFADTASAIQRLGLPSLPTADLFEREKLVYRRNSGASTPSPRIGTPAAMIQDLAFSPGPGAKAALHTPGALRFNPAVPLWQHEPRPCINFYLLPDGCKFRKGCKYSHDYAVAAEDLQAMRHACKQQMCESVKLGKVCPKGDGCIFRHKCRNGPGCPFLKKGNCKAGGSEVH